MAYIQPSTNIVLIKNCILQKSDNNETDTLYFETEKRQTDYFDRIPAIDSVNPSAFYGSTRKITYSPTTYQNMGQGVMRIGKTMKQLYGCNYMYFTNKDSYTITNNDVIENVSTGFEGKRYYCFIDGLKYINNNCTEVYYSVDYIQTFMFDYEEKTCLVERMTTDDDAIGKYLQPEPVTYSTNQFCYGRYEIKSYNTYSVAYPMLCQPEFIYYTIDAETDSLTGIFLNISDRPNTGYAAMCVTLQVEPYANLFGILDLDNGDKSNAKVSVPNYSLLISMTVDGYIKVVNDLTIVTTTPPSDYPAVGTVYTFTTLNVNNAYIQRLFSGDWWHGISGNFIEGTSGTDRYARFVENISSAIVFPTAFIGTTTPKYVGNITDIALQKTYWKHFVKRDSLFGIDDNNTYEPKNNKLLTYPFKYGMYGTLSGERMEYRYELLPTSITSYSDDVNYDDTENGGLRFSILHCILPTPTALCVARNYYCNNLGYYYGMSSQGKAQYDDHSYEFGVAFNDFPSIPTTIDGYNEYLAETSSSFRTGLLKSLLNISLVRHATETEQKKLTADAIAVKGVHYAGVEAAKAGISAGLSYLERQTNAVLNHNSALGVFSAPNLITSAGYSGFYFWDYGVDVESAKVIDSYFTRYGYKLNQNIEPSRNNNGKRENFTFIKTIECNLAINQYNSSPTGSYVMSQEDEKAIEAIYNNGVRFWYGTSGTGSNIKRRYKDYSVDNQIVTNPSNNNNSSGNT